MATAYICWATRDVKPFFPLQIFITHSKRVIIEELPSVKGDANLDSVIQRQFHGVSIRHRTRIDTRHLVREEDETDGRTCFEVS